MTTELIGPLEPLKDRLIEGIRTSTQCLWCVAYVDAAAVNCITATLQDRLRRSSTFSFRLLFQDYGFRTEPAALASLVTTFKECGRQQSLRVKWANSRRFHAKAYGFKKGAREHVILGSGNLTSKAINGLGSGELMVRLSNIPGSGAWDELEAFWDEGTLATTRWLSNYQAAHKRNLKLQRSAKKDALSWKKVDRAAIPRNPTSDPWKMRVYVQHVFPLDKATRELINKQAAHSEKVHDIEFPVGCVAYSKRKEAYALPKGSPILEFFWRSEEDAHMGLRSIMIKTIKRIVPIGNPKLGRHWLVCSQVYRGEKRIFNKKTQAKIESLLNKNKLAWEDLRTVNSYLRLPRK